MPALNATARDHKVKFWDVPSGKLVHTLDVPTDELSEVAISDEGKLLITGGSDLKFWKVVR
jgi:WD40 repeat protein